MLGGKYLSWPFFFQYISKLSRLFCWHHAFYLTTLINSSNQGVDYVILLKYAFYIENSTNFKKFVKSMQVICTRDSTKVLKASLWLFQTVIQIQFLSALMRNVFHNSFNLQIMQRGKFIVTLQIPMHRKRKLMLIM